MQTTSSLAHKSFVGFLGALLFLGSTVLSRAQSALDGFDPNANSQIFAVVMQRDGKILIGGQFTMLSPNGGPAVARVHIARLNQDGTLDTAFNPSPDGNVLAIGLQADGKIVIGGGFNGVSTNGGAAVTRKYIARLNADGSLDTGFDPWATASIETIVVQADGKILVGGGFTAFFPNAGSTQYTRHGIARLDVTGIPDSFNPNATTGEVLAIALQTDGKILAAGSFTNIGGAARNYLARIDPATGAADSWNPSANNVVRSLVVQSDGKIVVAGDFNGAAGTPTIGGQPRNRLARLDATTGAADSWDPGANDIVRTVAVQADGKILVGGSFSFLIPNAGTTVATRRRIARLSATTGFADSFDPNVQDTGGVNTIVLQADGKIIFAGSFGVLAPDGGAGVVRNCIARTAGPPLPTAAVSRKLHAGVPFDINLPLTGGPGIECRSGGATNDYQVVFTFPGVVTFSSATVTSGTGSVSGTSGSGTATPTVNLTGVTNAQRVMVTLAGVNSGTSAGDVAVQMGVLVADVNGSGSVTASDIGQTKAAAGQPVTSANFRADVNANGAISASDISQVKSLAGTVLPP